MFCYYFRVALFGTQFCWNNVSENVALKLRQVVTANGGYLENIVL